MEKYQRQVVHVYFKNSDFEKTQHHYFGSVLAMYQRFTPEQLGVAMQTLYNQWKSGEWENDKIILRKGKLITTKN